MSKYPVKFVTLGRWILMTEIELMRKELDRLIIEKEFNLADTDVVRKALEFEAKSKNMDPH